MKLTDATIRALKPNGKTQKLSDGAAMHAPIINAYQRRALLALMDAEAARVPAGQRERRAALHRLFALVRLRFGCEYSCLEKGRFREAARRLMAGQPHLNIKSNNFIMLS